MDIGYIGLDVCTPRLDVVRIELAPAQGGVKMLMHAVAYRVGEQFFHLLDRTILERLVGRRNRQAEIATGRLQAAKGRAFAGPMYAYQRFEEMRVCEFARLSSEFAYRPRLVEHCSNLALVLGPHPGQDLSLIH